jgi:hypothetical protein
LELVCLLRGQGMVTALVGMTPGTAVCGCGVFFQPDSCLAQAGGLLSGRPQLVVLAGDAASATQALIDPRLLGLIGRALAAGGYVAAMTGAYRPLAETGALRSARVERVLRQGGGETAVFGRQLVQVYRQAIKFQ